MRTAPSLNYHYWYNIDDFMWQAQDGLIDTLFALAWGLRTFRVAGILTSPLCWWFGWLLWHLHLACHLARAAKEVYDGPDSKNHHASSMNLDFSSFLRCISTGSMISWTMKVVKCPVLSPYRSLCMLRRWFMALRIDHEKRWNHNWKDSWHQMYTCQKMWNMWSDEKAAVFYDTLETGV